MTKREEDAPKVEEKPNKTRRQRGTLNEDRTVQIPFQSIEKNQESTSEPQSVPAPWDSQTYHRIVEVTKAISAPPVISHRAIEKSLYSVVDLFRTDGMKEEDISKCFKFAVAVFNELATTKGHAKAAPKTMRFRASFKEYLAEVEGRLTNTAGQSEEFIADHLRKFAVKVFEDLHQDYKDDLTRVLRSLEGYGVRDFYQWRVDEMRQVDSKQQKQTKEEDQSGISNEDINTSFANDQLLKELPESEREKLGPEAKRQLALTEVMALIQTSNFTDSDAEVIENALRSLSYDPGKQTTVVARITQSESDRVLSLRHKGLTADGEIKRYWYILGFDGKTIEPMKLDTAAARKELGVADYPGLPPSLEPR